MGNSAYTYLSYLVQVVMMMMEKRQGMAGQCRAQTEGIQRVDPTSHGTSKQMTCVFDLNCDGAGG